MSQLCMHGSLISQNHLFSVSFVQELAHRQGGGHIRGLMPQHPVVRHTRAVGPVPSTATVAALFNIKGRQETRRGRKRRGEKVLARVNAWVHPAFGPKADADAPISFRPKNTGRLCW